MITTFNEIKKLQLEINEKGLIDEHNNEVFSITVYNDHFLVSHSFYQSKLVEGKPEFTREEKIKIKITDSLRHNIEEMVNVFSSYQPEAENETDFSCQKIYIYVITDNAKYRTGANTETVKLFYNFLLFLNLPKEIYITNIQNVLNNCKEGQKGSWTIYDDLKEESQLLFKFAHTNIKEKTLNELIVYINQSSDFIIEGKSTIKHGDIYTILSNKLTYSENKDIIKDKLESNFKCCEEYSAILTSDDYCSLEYDGKKIEFERKYLNNDFFDFLNFYDSKNAALIDSAKQNLQDTLENFNYISLDDESCIITDKEIKDIGLDHDTCVILESMYAYDNGGIESGSRDFIFIFYEEYDESFKCYNKYLLKIDIAYDFFKASKIVDKYWYIDEDNSDHYKEKNYYKFLRDLLNCKKCDKFNVNGVVREWCPDKNRYISIGQFKKKDLTENLFKGILDEETQDILTHKIPSQLSIYDTQDIGEEILNLIPRCFVNYYEKNFMSDSFFEVNQDDSKIWDGKSYQ